MWLLSRFFVAKEAFVLFAVCPSSQLGETAVFLGVYKYITKRR